MRMGDSLRVQLLPLTKPRRFINSRRPEAREYSICPSFSVTQSDTHSGRCCWIFIATFTMTRKCPQRIWSL